MRLVKVCLEDNIPFWFFGNIKLTPKARVSSLFNIDELGKEDIEKINADIFYHIIRAFDKDGSRITDLNKHNLIGGSIVDNEDTPINKEDIPEIISVTCNDEEEEEDKEILSTEEDYDEANIILNKNGNTARKSIYNFVIDKNNIGIIKACLEIESGDRNRKGIIKACQEKLEEYNG